MERFLVFNNYMNSIDIYEPRNKIDWFNYYSKIDIVILSKGGIPSHSTLRHFCRFSILAYDM